MAKGKDDLKGDPNGGVNPPPYTELGFGQTLQTLTDNNKGNEAVAGRANDIVFNFVENQAKTEAAKQSLIELSPQLLDLQRRQQNITDASDFRRIAKEGRVAKELQTQRLATEDRANTLSYRAESARTRASLFASKEGTKQAQIGAGATRFAARQEAGATRYGAKEAAAASRFGSAQQTEQAQIGASAQRYGAREAADASRYGAEQAAGASRYGSQQAAAASRYGSEQQTRQAQIGAGAQRYEAEQAAGASRYGAEQAAGASRYGAEQAAGASRYGAEQAASASRYGAEQAAGASRYGSEQQTRQAEIGARAQRYTADTQLAASREGYQSQERQIGLQGSENRKALKQGTDETIRLRADARGAINSTGRKFFG